MIILYTINRNSTIDSDSTINSNRVSGQLSVSVSLLSWRCSSKICMRNLLGSRLASANLCLHMIMII